MPSAESSYALVLAHQQGSGGRSRPSEMQYATRDVHSRTNPSYDRSRGNLDQHAATPVTADLAGMTVGQRRPGYPAPSDGLAGSADAA